jgi:hypothetical protein
MISVDVARPDSAQYEEYLRTCRLRSGRMMLLAFPVEVDENARGLKHYVMESRLFGHKTNTNRIVQHWIHLQISGSITMEEAIED